MNPKVSSFVIALIAIVISMAFSMVGLTNVIKYGYNYCGILGVLHHRFTYAYNQELKKNKKFLGEHPEYVGE